MKKALTSLCFVALISGASIAQADSERTMLVLDASGSMWGQLEGKTKIEIARDALQTLVSDWPAGREVGLVAYGHRKKGDCADIETLIPVGPLDAEQMTRTVNALNPKGKTPLSAAVKQAAEALKYTEEKATVVLLSDGKETCAMNPCTLGDELEKLGVDFTAHVIGFDVTKQEDQTGLRCLAENTGGQFIPAGNAAELTAALEQAAIAPEPVITPEPTPEPEPTPLPQAKLIAPESAIKGTALNIDLQAEQEGLAGYVYLYPKGNDKSITYAYARADKIKGYQSTSLRLPAIPGEFELKWVTKKSKAVIAEASLLITEADISIETPESATKGTVVDVQLNAPEGLNGYIYLYPQGKDKSITYGYVKPDNIKGYQTTPIRLPAIPGEFTLKWITKRKETIAERPLTITDAEVSLTAPESAPMGTAISIQPKAPDGLNGYIYLYPQGKDKSITYGYIKSDPIKGYKPTSIRLPAVPGQFTLKWSTKRKEIIAETSLTVEAIEAVLEAPEQAEKGTTIPVTLQAPDGLNGYIYLYPKGKDKRVTYGYVREDTISGYKPTKIKLPDTTGAFTLKWLTKGKEVLAEQPLQIVDEIVE